MRLFLVNIILALIWAALTTDFKAENIAIGFGISFIILAITSHIWSTEDKSYMYRAALIIKFILFLIWDMLSSNIRVARDVIKPRLNNKAGVIAVDLDVQSDLEITLLANIVAFTPGTLTLDVSSDRKKLFFHTMYADDIEGQREAIKNRIEKRIAGILE
jgi:multicomponent Na+:H+ antiporter subunit E